MGLSCERCQTPLIEHASYCHHCGRRVAASAGRRRVRTIRGTIIAAAIAGVIAWALLFVEVESVLVTGPILLLCGITLIVSSKPIGYVRGWVLGVMHCGICVLLVALVNLLDWSPRDAEVPFICIGIAYLIVTLLLAAPAYRSVPEQHDPSRCMMCGYLLYGLAEPRCPECGTPFDPATVGVPPQDEQRSTTRRP